MSENQNIEYKESWRDEYLKWICGFANVLDGKIFIGEDVNNPVRWEIAPRQRTAVFCD